MKVFHKYFEANKNLWNQKTAVHLDSEFYGLEEFKNGANSLTEIELKELGDVKGKSLLHLQCHFGMDTMSWSRLGANCVGVDLSDEAIKAAKKINDELNLNAEFICCNVYDLHPENIKTLQTSPLEGFAEAGVFDIVFTSYGTIGWLPDLDKWAELISYHLKPGGIFYIADFHPVLWMFDDDFTHIKYYYDNREVIETESIGTYTDRNAEIKGKEYGWNHSISEILNALIRNGLKIELFNEHMYSPFPCFNNLVAFEKNKWHIKGMEGKIPMVYSIKAQKG